MSLNLFIYILQHKRLNQVSQHFDTEDEEEGHDLEGNELAIVNVGTPRTPRGSLVRSARAQAELKFCYVVSAQIYGKQKNSLVQADKDRAADISYLMQKYVFVPFFTRHSCGLSNFPGSVVENRVKFWNNLVMNMRLCLSFHNQDTQVMVIFMIWIYRVFSNIWMHSEQSYT